MLGVGVVWDEKNQGKLLNIGGIGGNIVGCWRFFLGCWMRHGDML